MKRFREALAWAGALLVAGIFLLLKNLNVFGQWGDLIWGALFAAAGIGFLVWFAFDVQRWWRVIPGFTLVSVGAWIILQWRNVALGEWSGALVLFGMALGFWAIALVRGDHWWAVIPAGVLTVLGALFGLWSRLTDLGRMALLVVGIGLVFVLLYVIRFGQRDTRWSAVPAAALLLLGLVTLMDAVSLPAVLADWWPALLIVAGLGVGVGVLGLRGAARPVAPAVPDFDAPAPAPGASITSVLPEATVPMRPVAPLPAAPSAPRPEPAPAQPGPAAGPIDIYEVIKQQPAVAAPEAQPEPTVAPVAAEGSGAKDEVA